jgi:hypothetical protein
MADPKSKLTTMSMSIGSVVGWMRRLTASPRETYPVEINVNCVPKKAD